MVVRTTPRVVTIGGGHGQAALLAALRRLRCEVTAVVSVADDGGCSGQLTRQFAMPPPGDLRRCLTSLARDEALAASFERRVCVEGDETQRSAGNLALLHAYTTSGSLQLAADWAAEILGCWGRVVPAAEQAGKLAVYDRGEGTVHGETTVARRAPRVMVVAVHGVEHSNPEAHRAIAEADLVVLGPGSFVTSTLAAITTGQIADALSRSRAPKLLIHNITPEPGQLTEFRLRDYLRMLRDHIGIHSHGAPASNEQRPLAVLCHREGGKAAEALGEVLREGPLEDGSMPAYAKLTCAGVPSQHDPERLAGALASLFDLQPRDPSLPYNHANAEDDCHGFGARANAANMADRRAVFERYLRAGEALLRRGTSAC